MFLGTINNNSGNSAVAATAHALSEQSSLLAVVEAASGLDSATTEWRITQEGLLA